MNKDELYKSVELNELIRSYKALLRINTAFIKYVYVKEIISIDSITDAIRNMELEKIAIILSKQQDLLNDIYEICEESGINYDR